MYLHLFFFFHSRPMIVTLQTFAYLRLQPLWKCSNVFFESLETPASKTTWSKNPNFFFPLLETTLTQLVNHFFLQAYLTQSINAQHAPLYSENKSGCHQWIQSRTYPTVHKNVIYKFPECYRCVHQPKWHHHKLILSIIRKVVFRTSSSFIAIWWYRDAKLTFKNHEPPVGNPTTHQYADTIFKSM